MKITRRTLAAAGLAPAAALAQSRPEASSESPEELLKNAREQVRRNSEALAKVQVPMSTEPAFQFKP